MTNSIEANEDRPSCGVLANKMLSPEEIDAGADDIGVLFAPGDATKVDSDDDDGNGDDDGDDDGVGSTANGCSPKLTVDCNRIKMATIKTEDSGTSGRKRSQTMDSATARQAWASTGDCTCCPWPAR